MANLRSLSMSLRNQLPQPVVEGAATAMTSFGTATSSLRMLPEFLIVGGQRCGTTTMYRLLSEHPEIVRPTMSKGIGYFDLNYASGLRWYQGHFPVALGRNTRRGRRVTFESSGYYSYHPLAAGRIARDLPDVKVVMLVRDPVERAYSAYKHEFRRGFESEEFERALDLEPERMLGEVERMIDDPSYESFEHRHHSYAGRGQYVDQIERLRSAVGVDRTYVIDADDFFADPRAEYEALTDWLDLSRWQPADVGQWNATKGDDMRPATRRRLEQHFAPYDARLAELTGRPPSWRR